MALGGLHGRDVDRRTDGHVRCVSCVCYGWMDGCGISLRSALDERDARRPVDVRPCGAAAMLLCVPFRGSFLIACAPLNSQAIHAQVVARARAY